MDTHKTPRQCLAGLKQEISDGGRSEYLDQEESMGLSSDFPEGDCAVVAAVHAAFQRPSGQAYRDARRHLAIGIHPRVFNHRSHGEPVMSFVLRRIRQCFRRPNIEPMHGTPNRATLSYLRILGYRHIYPNAEQGWYCICDQRCSYHVDMVMLGGGGHAICVQKGTAYSTIPFDPGEIEVGNVLRLGPDETARFKALVRYNEDHKAWLDRMIESRDWNWDWSSEPKLDDYLNL